MTMVNSGLKGLKDMYRPILKFMLFSKLYNGEFFCTCDPLYPLLSTPIILCTVCTFFQLYIKLYNGDLFSGGDFV